MPEGTFDAQCPLPEHLPKTARDRARLTTAHFAKDKEDLRNMLDMLDLWPASDGETLREIHLIAQRDVPNRRRR